MKKERPIKLEEKWIYKVCNGNLIRSHVKFLRSGDTFCMDGKLYFATSDPYVVDDITTIKFIRR